MAGCVTNSSYFPTSASSVVSIASSNTRATANVIDNDDAGGEDSAARGWDMYYYQVEGSEFGHNENIDKVFYVNERANIVLDNVGEDEDDADSKRRDRSTRIKLRDVGGIMRLHESSSVNANTGENVLWSKQGCILIDEEAEGGETWRFKDGGRDGVACKVVSDGFDVVGDYRESAAKLSKKKSDKKKPSRKGKGGHVHDDDDRIVYIKPLAPYGVKIIMISADGVRDVCVGKDEGLGLLRPTDDVNLINDWKNSTNQRKGGAGSVSSFDEGSERSVRVPTNVEVIKNLNDTINALRDRVEQLENIIKDRDESGEGCATNSVVEKYRSASGSDETGCGEDSGPSKGVSHCGYHYRVPDNDESVSSCCGEEDEECERMMKVDLVVDEFSESVDEAKDADNDDPSSSIIKNSDGDNYDDTKVLINSSTGELIDETAIECCYNLKILHDINDIGDDIDYDYEDEDEDEDESGYVDSGEAGLKDSKNFKKSSSDKHHDDGYSSDDNTVGQYSLMKPIDYVDVEDAYYYDMVGKGGGGGRGRTQSNEMYKDASDNAGDGDSKNSDKVADKKVKQKQARQGARARSRSGSSVDEDGDDISRKDRLRKLGEKLAKKINQGDGGGGGEGESIFKQAFR